MTPQPPEPSLDRPGDFRDLLHRFEDRLRSTGAGVVDLLAPGINEDQVRSELAALGMEPAGELVMWFGWHNGLTTANPGSYGDGCLPAWCPLSLGECVKDWERLPRGPEIWQWKPTGLPIGVSGGAVRLAVDCTPPQAHWAKVRMAAPDAFYFDESQIASVAGFATVVGWWIDALEQGWYRFDADLDTWDGSRWGEMPVERRRTGLV